MFEFVGVYLEFINRYIEIYKNIIIFVNLDFFLWFNEEGIFNVLKFF